MGFQFHYRKLLHHRNQHTISHGSSYSPSPSPSPSSPSPSPSPSPLQYYPSLSLPIPFIPIFPVHDDWLHTHLLQVAMIVLGCTLGFLMLICTLSIIRRHYYYSRRRNNHMTGNTPILFYVNGDSAVSASDGDDEGPIIDHHIWFIRTEGLQQSVIDSITVFIYRKDEGMIDGTECSVCLGEFQEDESLRLLPKCSHAFHIPCIDTWLRSHKNCPLCRAPVVHDASGGGGGSEVRVTEFDSNVSGQNQEISAQIVNIDRGIGNPNLAESEISALRNNGYDDDSGVLSSTEDGGSGETLDRVNYYSSIQIESHDELEEEIQPMRRSISMDSCSAAMMFHDVVELNCDQLGDRINSKGKGMKVEKQASGSGSSTAICKLASIGRALQKRPISLRGSFSSRNNRKSSSSRHCRSQSSTLPL